MISPFSPIMRIVMGSFCLNSYSDIACLQLPQGAAGVSTRWVFDIAEIAIDFIVTPGYFDPAWNTATRSAHKPEGYEAFS